MEKKILLVSANKVHSKKNDEDYYIVEYVDIYNNSCKSLVRNIKDMSEEEFNKYKLKVKEHDVVNMTGIFELNKFDKAELVNIK